MLLSPQQMIGFDFANQLLRDLQSGQKNADPRFPNGLLGQYYYLGLSSSSIARSDGFKRGIELLVRQTFVQSKIPSLYSGAGGALFVAHYFAPSLATELDPKFEQFARAFFDQREGYHELITGITGVGILADLRRNSTLRRWTIRKLTAAIEETALGYAWTNRSDYFRLFEEKPKRPQDFQVNLGLAHGILGPLLFLVRQSTGPDADLARRSLNFVIPTLRKLSDLYREEPLGCALPPLEDEEVYPPSGWCYGDPGLGITLVQAGRHLEDFELFESGIQIAKRGLSKIKVHPKEELHLCHGTAGHALMADRLWRLTDDPEFHRLKKVWLQRTQDLIAGKKIAELMSYDDPRFSGFLYGAIGADLVMHETTRLRKSRWDAFMMTDE